MDQADRRSAEFADRLEIERAALMLRRAPLGYAASVVGSLALAFVMLFEVRWAVVLAWLAASLALVGMRIVLARRRQPAADSVSGARRLAREATVGALFNGVMFLLPSVWLVPPGPNAVHLTLIVVGAVMPAMSMTTLGGYAPAVIAFSAPLLLGYAGAAMFSGHWLIVGLGVAAAIHFVVIAAISNAVDRDVHTALLRSFEIEALNDDLVAARTAAETAAARLAQHGEELERRVEERTASLTHAMHELESFSYSVSHDLRTPLRAINGYTTLLDEEFGPQASGEAREYLDRIRKATERLDRLIDELLDLSRMARMEIDAQPVDLSMLAHSVTLECASLFPDRRVTTIIEPDLHACGDPLLLRAVLQNLLWNAWKFTAPQAEPRIEFRAERSGEEIAYCVADNGVGFDMQYADKLFRPFQRLHGVAEFAGSGIGLATVARIVARHGGRVWAESAPGRGARFRFTLGATKQAVPAQ